MTPALSPLTAVLVEDQAMFLEMLRGALGMYGGVEVIGAATMVSEGIATCRRCAPDVLIIDLSLPDGSGLEVAQHALASTPTVKVIVLSAQVRTFVCPDWLQPRLHAVVDKNRTFLELRAALDRLRGGDAAMQHSEEAAVAFPADEDAAADDGDDGLRGKPLSAREQQVFTLIGEGLVNRLIAERLQLSEETIRAHRKRIARKLGTRGNELLKRAIEHRTRADLPLDR